MKELLPRILAALAIVALLATNSAASAILNGSFETPDIPADSYQCGYVTPTSWSWSSSIGCIFDGTVFNPIEGSNWPSPLDGEQFVDIGNVSTSPLSQDFAVSDGGTYQLAWHDNAHSNGLTSPYSVSILDDLQQEIAHGHFDAAHGGAWQNRTLLVSLAPGNYTLVFTANGQSGGYDTLIDRVILTGLGSFICGDANGSGGDPAVDIDDVVYLINYIFSGGPAPEPIAAGDADCSGGDPPVDIDDVVYLINYIFAGGPEPCAECE